MLRRSSGVLLPMLCLASVLLLGCGSETNFEWDVPAEPQRIDALPFGGPDTRGFRTVSEARGTFHFPDGETYFFEAPIMRISINESSDDNLSSRDDLVRSVTFEVATEREHLVGELERFADAARVRVDGGAVQEWIDTHDPEVDRSILIPITGWREDSYAMYMTVEDEPGHEHRVSLAVVWTHTLGDFLTEQGRDPNLSEEFDIRASPFLLP